MLDLLDRNDTQATFFVLGWVARRYPRLVREIRQRGHEIGCHSLDHQLVHRMSPNQFYESTAAAKELIESVIQEPIFGYRAPCFSITPGCEWAFDALAKLGFSYDSSVDRQILALYRQTATDGSITKWADEPKNWRPEAGF